MINKKIHNTIIETNKTFGLLFGFLFLFIGLWNYNIGKMFIVFIVLSSIFFLLSLSIPRIFYPLNFVWYWIGKILHKITNPIILIAIFYLVFTPLGLLKKATRKKGERGLGQDGYWVIRHRILTFEDLKRQF